jgi:hypothetical protein
MGKSVIEESRVLPTIDEQIDYVKTLRNDVVKYLKNGLDMVFAIEQNLLAVKLNSLSQKRHEEKISKTKSISEDICYEILVARSISVTSLRLDVLREILQCESYFSITEIFNKIMLARFASRTAVGKVVHLFEEKDIIEGVQNEQTMSRRGRPEKYFCIK